jgi:hypothetical protein
MKLAAGAPQTAQRHNPPSRICDDCPGEGRKDGKVAE